MQHLIFGVGAGAIVLLAARAYYRFERWNRRRRLRGALECLDAVHNTLASLAERKSIDAEIKNYAVLHVPPKQLSKDSHGSWDEGFSVFDDDLRC